MKFNISSAHLTRGQRQYLARKGIKGSAWDKMPLIERKEWLEEMEEGAYELNDRELNTQNNKFYY